MTTERTTENLARLAAEATGAATEMARVGQELALGALRAEMMALAAMMPGAAAHQQDEAARAAREAEVEAGFDNMPV